MTDADALAKLDELPIDGELTKISGEVFDSKNDLKHLPNFAARLTIIRILNDSQLFEIDGTKAKEIRGVIVELQNTKTCWEKGYDQSGGGKKPICFSNDGIYPHSNSIHPQADRCAACARNKFYDDPDPERRGKKKKDCRDTITMYLYNPKEELPLLIRASTMNRKPVADYIKALAKKGYAKEMVITKFTLVKDNETAKIEFSGLRLEVLATIKSLIDFYKEENGEVLNVQQVAQRIKQFKDDNEESFNSSSGTMQELNNPLPPPTENTPKDYSAPPKTEDSIEVNLDEPAISEEMAEPPF